MKALKFGVYAPTGIEVSPKEDSTLYHRLYYRKIRRFRNRERKDEENGRD